MVTVQISGDDCARLRRLGRSSSQLRRFRRSVFILLACFLLPSEPVLGQAAQDLLRQTFGDDVLLDPNKVVQVKREAQGKRHWFDTTGDGRANECWYICIDPRHQTSHRPLLLRVVDEDGDMDFGIQPDRDSDLYIADWAADGTVDAITDHEDLDRDDDLDRMGMYYQLGNSDRLRVWYSFDDGDDNLLWWDQGYRYYQNPNQHHTHFGGDETFINYQWNNEDEAWEPLWEAPFLFYDNDSDGVTDEVVRVEPLTPDSIGRLRWSFDVDGDATRDEPRDFDVSISAHAGPGTTFPLPAVESFVIRGAPTGTTLSRAAARDWLRQGTFRSGLFTWVENDHNVGWSNALNREDPVYPHERWEGVLANGHPGFQQIGGPPVGPFDHRQESAFQPQAQPFRYYFSPATHRIHLHGASKGWLVTDFDGDFAAEMRYEYLDLDPVDGIFDQVTLDVDDDGRVDDRWHVATDRIVELPFVWQEFQDAYKPVLEKNPALLYTLDRRLADALETVAIGSSRDAVWTLIQNRFAGIPEPKRVKLLHSDMALLYYLELVRDRRIVKLRSLTADRAEFWASFQSARGSGDLAAMAELLVDQFSLAAATWQPAEAWIGELRDEQVRRVGWSGNLATSTFGWESEKVAYRFDRGKLDFFGKREKRLVLDESVSGDETDDGGWGMDALDIRSSSGCGGLTLWINGTPFPVRSDGGGTVSEFRVALIDQSAEELTVEALAVGVGPSVAPRNVRLRATAFAGRADSRMEVTVEGGPPGDQLALGVGFTRLQEQAVMEDESLGTFGIWGFQRPEIDWIGIGMVYSPADRLRRIDLDDEHQVILNVAPHRPVLYHIQADWLRGRRFPVRPSAMDWLTELGRTAASMELTGADAGRRQ